MDTNMTETNSTEKNKKHGKSVMFVTFSSYFLTFIEIILDTATYSNY